MTLTVEDLVKRLDEFEDDRKIFFLYQGQVIPIVEISKKVANSDETLFLSCEVSEEEDELEQSEDEESEDEE